MAHLVDHLVARTREVELTPDAGHLVGFADAAEQVHVGSGLPGAKAWAGTGTCGAALFAVDAVVEAQLFFDVEWDVLAFFVFIPDHVVGAGDDATSAAGAQVVGDDFAVQLFPLCGPALLLGGSFGWRLDRRHTGDCTPRRRGNINPPATESHAA